MKQGLIKTIAISCLMVLQLSAQVAQAQAFEMEGNSSGGGTGDGAFAMQQLIAANPSLAPVEVLEKVFNESQGSIPRIVVKANSCQGTICNQTAVFDYGTKSFSANFGDTNYGQMRKLSLERSIVDMGPLIGSQTQDYVLNVFDGSGELVVKKSTKILPTGFIAVVSETQERPEMESEFRAFGLNVMVVRIAFKAVDNSCAKAAKFSGIDMSNLKPVGQLCVAGYGYYWK